MGSHLYYYFTKYQPDVNRALQELRQQEFQAGRYDPAMNMHDPKMWMFEFQFPPTAASIAPGAKHSSIEEVWENMSESGTGSILDIQGICEDSEFLCAHDVSDKELQELFGTDKPTRQMIEQVLFAKPGARIWDPVQDDKRAQFFETMDRGQARYIILYEDDTPSEILFLGFSID